MDKLKNLVNPGSKKDDDVMYGSGISDDPVHSGTAGTHSGQGSHLASSRSAANDPLSSSSAHPTSGTSGLGHTTGNDPLATSTNPTGGSQYDTGSSGRGSQGLNEPYASRMPGGFDDDAATTASVRSGVPGQVTQTGSGMTGTRDPSITNKPLPSEPTNAGVTGSSGSSALRGNDLTGNSYPDRSVGSSGPDTQSTGSSHLGRDAALGAGAVGAGAAAHHHHNKNDPQSTGSSHLGRDAALGAGAVGAGEAAHHHHNKNDLQSTGSSHLGRDAALGAGAVGTGAAAHHHHNENTQRDNYAPETGRSFPLGGNSNTGTGSHPVGGSTSTTTGPHSSALANKADPRVDSDLDGSRTTGQTGYGSGLSSTSGSTHPSNLGRDAALGSGTGATTGGVASGLASHGPESWQHGHQYGGDPCGPEDTKAPGPHHISGPHATDTANRLDPHVAGGVGGTETMTGHHGHHNKEAALAGGATGAGLGAYEGSRGPHSSTAGDSTSTGLGSSNTAAGTSSTGPAPNTAGPHKSDILNKMDPRVDSDLSKQQPGTTNTTGSGYGSSTSGGSGTVPSHGAGHRGGEEAALGGAAVAGAATYEGDKHHRHNEPNLTGSTVGTHSSASPYSSSAIDPRVGNERSNIDNTATTGTGRDHHIGRDAGLGAGAGGLAYEAERHHGQHAPTNIASGTTGGAYGKTRDPSSYDNAGSQLAGSSQQPATTKDHHYGRDATVGAGLGGAAYEAEKHHGKDHSGIASTPQDQLAGSGHQPQSTHTGHHNSGILGSGAATGAGTGNNRTTGRDPQHGRDRHLDRDAALGGAAIGAGAAGVDHHNKSHRQGDDLATYPSPGYGNEGQKHQSPLHGHRKEEEALAGGAAAGGLAHHEHSKKEDKALEKEHSKEVKHHEKEVAKEEKAAEKERAKHMAAIEKDQKKHEHDGEKKKGGLLGFLHRDKPDKDLKEEEARRKAGEDVAYRPGDETAAGIGAGSAVDPLAGEHGSQSGVHDTPIGTGSTTHDAYGTHDGHNKLHKDPPAKVLEARGQDYQGHGNVS